MDFKNYTPFAGMAWESWDSNGQAFVTSLLRLKFKLIPIENSEELQLQLLPDQGDLFGVDEFYDDEKKETVQYESDYVNYKPCADLVVNATTESPYDDGARSWLCGVALYDLKMNKLNSLRLQVKGVHNYGLREKTNEVAIRYTSAKPHTRYNPIEEGSYYNEQVFYADGTSSNVPAGFGFIHRSWKNRLDLAGTYDKKWIREQHPLPPHDFNYLHNQAAHPRLIVKNHIEPGSKVVLENLIGRTKKNFTIPEFKLLSRIITQTQSKFEVLMLDTLLIDLDSEEDNVVYASYRAFTPFFDTVKRVELMLIEEGA